jgi:hypothetical protein
MASFLRCRRCPEAADRSLIGRPLAPIHGVSKSRRGNGRPCIVCREAIAATDVEREVGVGIVMHAHEACYKVWRQESRRDAAPSYTPSGGGKV